MKPNQIFFILLLLFTISTKAQISKGNWMVGGSGSIYFYETNNSTVDKKFINKGFGIDLLPNVGYFFFNNFSVGLVSKFGYGESKDSDGGTGRSKTLNLGPFARYYLLDKEKMVNVFIQSSYDISLLDVRTKTNRLAGKVGTVIFLNNSVGLELNLEYSKSEFRFKDPLFNSLRDNTKILQFGIGLQIHLERE